MPHQHQSPCSLQLLFAPSPEHSHEHQSLVHCYAQLYGAEVTMITTVAVHMYLCISCDANYARVYDYQHAWLIKLNCLPPECGRVEKQLSLID